LFKNQRVASLAQSARLGDDPQLKPTESNYDLG